MNASNLCAYKSQVEDAYKARNGMDEKNGLKIVQLPLKMVSHEAIGKPPQIKGQTEGHNFKIS